MNTLREQQRCFAQFVVAGDDESFVSETLALKQSPSSHFKDAQRLQIYRNNFVISLREALMGVYPVIYKLTGEEFFQHVAREYIRHHPSRTGNLHDFGDKFAGFLQAFPDLEALPYLPDVARLEWAYHQVFHTAEDGVLNLSALAALDEKQTASLTFQLSNCCVWLTSDYPVLRIWQVNQNDQEELTVSLDEGGVQCVVLRHGQQIEFYPLSVGVFTLIDSLAKNNVFAQACEDALEAEADCDIAAALQFLAEKKIVSGFSHSS
ncbi:MAG: DUF2063 domain-containing protein [Gammaproteobacteria bacterium]|nr:DUF2063 domain-containing protein [Gammaproteobacteria bacterium]